MIVFYTSLLVCLAVVHWLVRWRANPKAAYREEVAALNKLLARGAYSRRVTAAGAVLG